MTKTTLLSFFLITLALNAQCKNKAEVVLNDTLTVKSTLIFSDNFDSGMDNWNPEQMPGGKVSIKNEKLEIEDAKGCSVWLKHKQNGPIMIEYDAFVIKADGPHDRVSDLNCFWMANDPENPDDFFKNAARRGGKFSNYDYLALYYVGTGGHYNSKTRFRRYAGTSDRPLLPEFDYSDKKYLITPNVVTKIKIVAYNGIIQYYRDGELYYDYFDENPYTSGYFGFRTVDNHMTIDNFRIYSLTK